MSRKHRELYHACIDMMEETHDIVAMGAGAVGKRMYYEENRHERVPNKKDLNAFINFLK